MSQKHIYLLENLGCANCAAKMEEQINQIEGITEATITFATKQLRIVSENPEQHLPQIQKICTSIESQVRVVEKNALHKTAVEHHSHVAHSLHDHCSHDHSSHDHCSHDHCSHDHCSHDHCSHNHEHSHHHEHKKALIHPKEHKESIQIILGIILFAAGLLLHHYYTNNVLSFFVFFSGYLFLGGNILLEAGRNILRGHIFDENFLMSIATIGAFIIGEYPEALGVMLFYRIGELFEHKAVEKSRSQIMESLDLRPEVVNLLKENQVQIVPAESVKTGDILIIRPGDRIPLDSKILEGESRLDTSPITGEPVPVSVKTGDKIFSGCLNTTGQLKVLVEKPLEDSLVSRILDSVENAAASKPKIDRFITRFARIYTPFVVLTAFSVAVIPSLFTGNWNYWIYTALTFLVISCPCALVLSVPLAFFSGIGAGSKKGILFKGGLSMEALSQVKAVVMDKTGTITKGDFTLQKILSFNGKTEEELLRLCASCEQHSSHPIAHSIVTAALEKGLSLIPSISMEEIAGHGIVAEFPEGTVLCGNQKLMEKHHISFSNIVLEKQGTEIFLAINETLAGSFLISDTIKPDAKNAIQHLKSIGLHTCMLTGDAEENASSVAAELNIDEVHAKLLPSDKLEIFSHIRQKHGAMLFVGDGINDAPVLAGADVGAAMGTGADAAIEAADAVFMTSNVESIPQAISIARTTRKIAFQNVVFALLIKAAVMVLGILGFANMWLAVFADTGVAMLCVLNSIRILYKKV